MPPKEKWRKLFEVHNSLVRKRKALQEWQEKQDINAISNMRLDRIYKKSRIAI